MKSILLAAAFGLAAAGAARAAPIEAPGRARLVQALSDCRKVAADAERLACYDRTAGALDAAESQGQVVVVDQAQANAVRRQAFGLHLPTLSIFSRTAPRSGEGVDHLTLVLEGARRGAEGKWVFLGPEGAVWRQTDEFELGRDPHKGSQLLIKNGLLGSYFCKVDDQPQVRCARTN